MTNIEMIPRDNTSGAGTGIGYGRLGHDAEQQRRMLDGTRLDLRMIGLITDGDAQKIEDLLADAQRAETYAAGLTAQRNTAIAAAAANLTGFDEAAVAKAATSIPSVDTAEVAYALAGRLIGEATGIGLAGIGRLPETINAQFSELLPQAEELAEQLSGIETPRDAIALDRVDAWRGWEEVAGTYAALRALVANLRYYRVIATPRPHDDDAAWYFRRKPVVVPKHPQPTEAEERAQLLADLRAIPYVPTGRDEVQAVRLGHRD